jgi:hypothetical protein
MTRRKRFFEIVGALAAILVVIFLLQRAAVPVAGQAPAGTGKAAEIKTPWGEADFQGIWSVELVVPLERPPWATGAFYTDKEVADLDSQRSKGSVFGNHIRAAPGSEADVNGAYNDVFTSQRPTGRRTGMVIDPPDGKIPPLTPEAQKRQSELRAYDRALMQNTAVCKDKLEECGGVPYGPPSPKRQETPPYYLTNAVNRADGPEDRSLGERCMGGFLPQFRGGFTGIYIRVVQSPGTVDVLYDVGQGQGFNRIIPVTAAPHLPSNVRQTSGDSRARWEGKTLVVDVTNFTAKRDLQGSRENLHLVERWTRTGPDTLEIVYTMDDPTVWTKPWTAIQEFKRQSNEANRIYFEPRCHEGNYGLPGLLRGNRADDKAFAEGKGPNPATKCIAGCASLEGRDSLSLR